MAKEIIENEIETDTQALNVRIPRELHERLRRWSFDNRRSIAEAIRNATTAWLDEQEKPTKRGKK